VKAADLPGKEFLRADYWRKAGMPLQQKSSSHRSCISLILSEQPPAEHGDDSRLGSHGYGRGPSGLVPEDRRPRKETKPKKRGDQNQALVSILSVGPRRRR